MTREHIRRDFTNYRRGDTSMNQSKLLYLLTTNDKYIKRISIELKKSMLRQHFVSRVAADILATSREELRKHTEKELRTLLESKKIEERLESCELLINSLRRALEELYR
jgi:hypothetical protein